MPKSSHCSAMESGMFRLCQLLFLRYITGDA